MLHWCHSVPLCLSYSVSLCLTLPVSLCLSHSISLCLSHSVSLCLSHSILLGHSACLTLSVSLCRTRSLCLPHSVSACVTTLVSACVTVAGCGRMNRWSSMFTSHTTLVNLFPVHLQFHIVTLGVAVVPHCHSLCCCCSKLSLFVTTVALAVPLCHTATVSHCHCLTLPLSHTITCVTLSLVSHCHCLTLPLSQELLCARGQESNMDGAAQTISRVVEQAQSTTVAPPTAACLLSVSFSSFVAAVSHPLSV